MRGNVNRVDVRVVSSQLRDHAAFFVGHPTIERIDFYPPASGPEAEVTFAGITETAIVTDLQARGITVLAVRTRGPWRGHG